MNIKKHCYQIIHLNTPKAQIIKRGNASLKKLPKDTYLSIREAKKVLRENIQRHIDAWTLAKMGVMALEASHLEGIPTTDIADDRKLNGIQNPANNPSSIFIDSND